MTATAKLTGRAGTETQVRIDRLVYELYGLTEEEIQVVEEGRQ